MTLPLIRKPSPSFASPRVKDKVVIITGANSPLGIGRASAYQFALGGARAIYLTDIDNSFLQIQKDELTAEFSKLKVHTRTFDCSDEMALREVIEDAISRYGRLDVFFANAGMLGRVASFNDLSRDEVMDLLNVNTLSVFLAAKHASTAMQKTCSDKSKPGGSIIVTASAAGLRANAGPTHSSASKAAVISMTQSIAFELAGTDVRMNAPCPGLVETGATSEVIKAVGSGGPTAPIREMNPLQRWAYADEIARVCVFLGSDEASYVNGQAWNVCGGFTSGHQRVAGIPGVSRL